MQRDQVSDGNHCADSGIYSFSSMSVINDPNISAGLLTAAWARYPIRRRNRRETRRDTLSSRNLQWFISCFPFFLVNHRSRSSLVTRFSELINWKALEGGLWLPAVNVQIPNGSSDCKSNGEEGKTSSDFSHYFFLQRNSWEICIEHTCKEERRSVLSFSPPFYYSISHRIHPSTSNARVSLFLSVDNKTTHTHTSCRQRRQQRTSSRRRNKTEKRRRKKAQKEIILKTSINEWLFQSLFFQTILNFLSDWRDYSVHPIKKA